MIQLSATPLRKPAPASRTVVPPKATMVAPTAVKAGGGQTVQTTSQPSALSTVVTDVEHVFQSLFSAIASFFHHLFSNGTGGGTTTVPGPVPTPTPTPIPTTPSGASTAANLTADQLRSGSFKGCLMGSSTPANLDTPDSLAAELGRPLDIDHSYYRWDDQVPSASDKADVAAGRVPFISWNAITHAGQPVSWADIASGKYDAKIKQVADGIKALGKPVLFTFNHEPENDSVKGTPADYKAAWAHISSIFQQEGATNAVKVFVCMGWKPDLSAQYYPGNAVDWVAGDLYNWADSTSHPTAKWESFQQVATKFHDWAKSTGKPIMIAETGCCEDPHDPNHKAQWIQDMGNTIKQWGDVKALAYFDNAINFSSGVDEWHIATPQAQAAWRSVAQDPYFSQH